MERFKSAVLKIVKIFLPDPMPAAEGEAIFTQRGLFLKLGYYAAFYLVSILIFVVPTMIEQLTGKSVYLFFAEPSWDTMTLPQIYLLTFCEFFIIIMPFLRYISKLVPVTGALYAFSQGYFFTFTVLMSVSMNGHVKGKIVCLVLSFVVAVLPYFLFRFLHIRMPAKMSTVVYILFWGSIFVSAIGKLLSFIGNPLGIMDRINAITDSTVGMVCTTIFQVMLPFLFLLLAYDTCAKYVRRKVPKKYEWAAFFAIFYTTLKLATAVQTFILFRFVYD